MIGAFAATPDRIELRLPSFLLTRGPYAYSRNPMYVSELTLWLGWAVFYGNVGVLIGFVMLFALVIPGVRYEERVLAARFGDAYREYSSGVPRWLGTPRQPESQTSLRASILRCLLRIRKAAIARDVPIETLRAMQQWSDRLIRLPRGVEIKPASTPDAAADWIIPARSVSEAVILYLHGGGWTLPLHNLERRMLARICRATTVPALAVDYALAPERPFPAALDDCVGAYRWLLKKGTAPQNVLVVGTSAGANLALATLMSLRDAGDPLPAALILISPMIDLAGAGESFAIDKDPAVAAGFALSMARHYIGNHDPRSPLLSPCYGDMRGLPPLLIHVGGDEIVLSDATHLRDLAGGGGVEVTLAIWPRMWHGWHIFVPYLPEAREAVDGIGTFVRKHLKLGGT
jgi:acetyl esterase/lipase